MQHAGVRKPSAVLGQALHPGSACPSLHPVDVSPQYTLVCPHPSVSSAAAATPTKEMISSLSCSVTPLTCGISTVTDPIHVPGVCKKNGLVSKHWCCATPSEAFCGSLLLLEYRPVSHYDVVQCLTMIWSSPCLLPHPRPPTDHAHHTLFWPPLGMPSSPQPTGVFVHTVSSAQPASLCTLHPSPGDSFSASRFSPAGRSLINLCRSLVKPNSLTLPLHISHKCPSSQCLCWLVSVSPTIVHTLICEGRNFVWFSHHFITFKANSSPSLCIGVTQ